MGLFDSPSHIVIVLVVLVLLFGSAKLPKLAKSLGESMRIFKSEAQKMQGDKAVQGQVQQPFTQAELPPQPPTANQQAPGAAAPAAAPTPEAQRTNQTG
jgi:sec-independent protein translocase protein TatA